MSRPMLSSAVRRLSHPRPICTATTASRAPGRPVSCFSASFGNNASGRRSYSLRMNSKKNITARQHFVPPSTVFRQYRGFSASTIRPATKVTMNPRKDDDGNTLTIDISERASERLREISDPSSSPSATKEENPYHHLRITVTSGGCHGFQYMMSLEPASKIDAEEDTVFEAEAPADGSAAGAGEAKVVMDEPSLELLSGSTVDYTMELIGSQFTIVNNPRATSNCGCGTSFDVND